MPVLIDGRVEPYRTTPSIAGIVVGAPVRAVDWFDLAKLVHFVRGHGRQLLPAHCPLTDVNATTTTVTHTYRVRGYGMAITRVWVGEVRGKTSGADAFGTVTIQAGASSTSGAISVGIGSAPREPFVYLETATSKGTGTQDLTFTITRTAGSATLVSLACWELPRAGLSRTSADLGIGLDSLFPRQPIYEATYQGPLAIATSIASTSTSRVGLVAWYQSSGVATSSAAFVNAFLAGIPVVPDLDRPTDTTRTVEGYVWAACTGTATGEFRVSDAAAATSPAVAITGTTYAFFGPFSKTFKAEDLSTSDGRRGGTGDTLQLQWRLTGGAGTVVIRGLTAYVSPV